MGKRKAASNHFRLNGRAVAKFISNRFLVGLLIIFVSLCFTNNAAAVIVPHENAGWENDISNWWLNSFRAGADSFGYYSLALYPTRGYAQLKEGENVEWIYSSLEHQYRFLDNTLYKLTGSNYLLGPVWNPLWHGFNDVHWLRASKKVARLPRRCFWPQCDAQQNESTASRGRIDGRDELITYTGQFDAVGYMDNSEELYEMSLFNNNAVTSNNGQVAQLTYLNDVLDTGMSSVPEPSSVILFGLAALGGLFIRKTA